MSLFLKINPELEIDLPLSEKILTQFLKQESEKFGFRKLILGLSGGIDSALVAALAAHAIGPQNVVGVKMPSLSSSKDSIEDANQLIEQLGIQSLEIPISPMLEPYLQMNSEITPLRRGNLMARTRMLVLFDQSMLHAALVMGTSNKTELLMGYGTQFGDMASALNPLGDLYKTQVFSLAEYLKLPASILKKAPSADLWPGQTDEDELGYRYADLDRFFYYWVDQRYPFPKLLELGFESDWIQKIQNRVRNNQYKRVPPLIARLSERSIEKDFLYPRDWGR